MENSDYSDSSDEDYVPNEGEIVSEEEDSGEEEDFVPGGDDEDGDVHAESQLSNKQRTKRSQQPKKVSKKLKSRRKPNDSKADEEEISSSNNLMEVDKTAKELEEKKKVDELWADFKKDVGGLNRSKAAASSSSSTSGTSSADASATTSSKEDVSSSSSSLSTAKSNRITISKEYDFAGETVVITKEVDAGSKEAKEAVSSNSLKTISQTTTAVSSLPTTPIASAAKRPSGGGLNALLGKLNKKPKMSTLEKSKLDWDGFKQKEGIEEDLKTHNRGKEGYLERVAFLQRADQRQFEIERDLRLKSAKK